MIYSEKTKKTLEKFQNDAKNNLEIIQCIIMYELISDNKFNESTMFESIEDEQKPMVKIITKALTKTLHNSYKRIGIFFSKFVQRPC